MKTTSTVSQNLPKNWEDGLNREIIPVDVESISPEFQQKESLDDPEIVRAVRLLKEKFSGVMTN